MRLNISFDAGIARAAACALALALPAADACAAQLPASGTYCRDGGRSVFSFRQIPGGSIDFYAVTATRSGDSVLSYYGLAKRVSGARWASGANAEDPDDKCRVTVAYSGAGWSIRPENPGLCDGHRGAHGPYDMPVFPASAFAHPATGPLQNADCPKASARHASGETAPAAGGASMQAASAAPAYPVQAVIAMDRGGWGSLFADRPTSAMREYFTEGFNASWVKAMSHDEDVLDGDPITGYQQVTRVEKVSATGGETGPATARMIAKLKVTYGGKTEPEQVTFDLKLENRHWKIDDITSGAMPSIRSYFRKSYGV